MINKKYYKKLGGFSYLLDEVSKKIVKSKQIFYLMMQ